MCWVENLIRVYLLCCFILFSQSYCTLAYGAVFILNPPILPSHWLDRLLLSDGLRSLSQVLMQRNVTQGCKWCECFVHVVEKTLISYRLNEWHCYITLESSYQNLGTLRSLPNILPTSQQSNQQKSKFYISSHWMCLKVAASTDRTAIGTTRAVVLHVISFSTSGSRFFSTLVNSLILDSVGDLIPNAATYLVFFATTTISSLFATWWEVCFKWCQWCINRFTELCTNWKEIKFVNAGFK